jgi:hypothetical protein
MSCKGDNTELCGAGSRLSVWSLDKYKANAGSSGTGTSGGSSSSATASAVPAATNVAYLGCYGETGNPRALTALYTSGSSMSVDLCAQKAQALNLQYFGLEYASQCLAGSVLNSASTPIAATKCSMKCAGNSTQTCGGSNAISMYNNTQYINPNPVNVPNQPGSQYGYVGCYTEGVGARALGPTDRTGSAATPASASLTVEACAAFCFAKGYNWMGVENSNLCFCNAAGPINSAVLAPEGEAGCNMACAGNPTQNCGAGSRLNVYQLKTGSASARFAGSTTTNSTTKTGKRGLRFKVW